MYILSVCLLALSLLLSIAVLVFRIRGLIRQDETLLSVLVIVLTVIYYIAVAFQILNTWWVMGENLLASPELMGRWQNVVVYLLAFVAYAVLLVLALLPTSGGGQKSESVEAVLLGLDGVLLDDERAIREAAIMALRLHGIEATPADFGDFVGMGEDRLIGGVAEKYGKPYSVDMKRMAYEFYDRDCRKYITVYDGVVDMIYKLNERGYRLAVCSDGDGRKVSIDLECMGIDREVFDAVISGNDIVNKKPHPEIYITAARKVGAAIGKCVVVENTVAGVQAGRAAGAIVVGVTTAFSADQLISAGADYIMTNTVELPEVVSKIR